ncbi:MAG: hypothetical protein PHU23_12855 [Dehalococcoidales bacterium]|nr:hypothetical protein [Dehalococcoidales bacterium]
MVMNSGINGVKGVKSVLGSDKMDFYPDLERVDKANLTCHNFILQDAKLVSDWDSAFGTSSFYLVKVKLIVSDTENLECTTILSGQAVMKQIRKLLEARKLPVAGTLGIRKSENGREYFVLDDPH